MQESSVFITHGIVVCQCVPGFLLFMRVDVCFLGRISPSDGDSVVSDHSSERESTEENLRAHATPSDSKQARKIPINVLNGKWPWQRSHHSSKHRERRRGRRGGRYTREQLKQER